MCDDHEDALPTYELTLDTSVEAIEEEYGSNIYKFDQTSLIVTFKATETTDNRIIKVGLIEMDDSLKYEYDHTRCNYDEMILGISDPDPVTLIFQSDFEYSFSYDGAHIWEAEPIKCKLNKYRVDVTDPGALISTFALVTTDGGVTWTQTKTINGIGDSIVVDPVTKTIQIIESNFNEEYLGQYTVQVIGCTDNGFCSNKDLDIQFTIIQCEVTIPEPLIKDEPIAGLFIDVSDTATNSLTIELNSFEMTSECGAIEYEMST